GVETQAQRVTDPVQTMLKVRVQAFGIEAAKKSLAGKIATSAVQIGKFFPAAQGAAGGSQAIDKTETRGGATHPWIGAGQHRRIKHDHPAIQLGTTQCCVQMKDTTEGMTDAPHGFRLQLKMVD